MLLPPRAQLVPVGLLALVLFPSFRPGQAYAQSSTQAELQLNVVSVKYLADKGKIEYKLTNDGQSAVTAYSVEISAVIRGNYDTWLRGPTLERRDLLRLELGSQCQSARTNSDDDDDLWPPPIKLPPGVIHPGKDRTDSMGSFYLLPDYLLQRGTPEVSAHVTGVIWADGRIEGTDEGIGEMQRVRDDWLEAAREERDVLAVLKAHRDDEDYQHRINVSIEGLQALMEGYPRQVPVPDDEPAPHTMYVWEPGLVSATIRELEDTAYQPNPIARLTSYIEFEQCAHERRAELQVPAMAGKPQR